MLDESCQLICGIDEAGRGPLIGNVVAGAVILDDKNLRNGLINSGNQRLNIFSWKNTYDKTIKFYNTLS